jgi:hypothetical protein
MSNPVTTQLSFDFFITVEQAARLRSCTERAIRLAVLDRKVSFYRDYYFKRWVSQSDLLACSDDVFLEQNLPPLLTKRGLGRPRKQPKEV